MEGGQRGSGPAAVTHHCKHRLQGQNVCAGRRVENKTKHMVAGLDVKAAAGASDNVMDEETKAEKEEG